MTAGGIFQNVCHSYTMCLFYCFDTMMMMEPQVTKRKLNPSSSSSFYYCAVNYTRRNNIHRAQREKNRLDRHHFRYKRIFSHLMDYL